MGQKPFTSAIPPKLTFCKTPARLRAPSYAPRWITGGIPVGLYLAFAVRSALRSPFTARLRPRSHSPGLALHPLMAATSLRHRCQVLLCCNALYVCRLHLSTTNFKALPAGAAQRPLPADLSEPCGKRSAREAGLSPPLRAVCFSPRWARGPASSAGRRIWSPSR